MFHVCEETCGNYPAEEEFLGLIKFRSLVESGFVNFQKQNLDPVHIRSMNRLKNCPG